MDAFPQVLSEYLRATIAYWWLLVLGVVIPLTELYRWHHPERKELRVPFWLRLTLGIGCLFVAQFLAYRDSIKNLSEVIEDKRQFNMAINELNQELQKRESDLAKAQQDLRDTKNLVGRNQPHVAAQNSPPRPQPSKPIQADQLRVVQEDVPSDHPDAPFAVKVTVEADKEIKQPTFEIICNSVISYAEVHAGMAAMMSSTQGPNGNTVRFSVAQPPISPGQPYTVKISAKQSIRVKGAKLIY